MPIIAANGMSFAPLDISLSDARNAIYAVVHRETQRVYVGMTESTVAIRWRQHCYDISRPSRKYHFGNALRSYGADAFDVFVVDHGLQSAALPAWEAHYVKLLAADIKNYGFNSTSGGDGGYVYTPEVKAKIGASHRGRVHSLEHRAKVSAALRKRKRKPESSEKTAVHRRGLKFSDEWRAALSASHLGKRPSDETRAKMSAAQKMRQCNPEVSMKHSEDMRRRWADPDYRERVSRKIKETHASPEVQAKLRAPRVLNDSTRELLSAAAHRRWNNTVRA